MPSDHQLSRGSLLDSLLSQIQKIIATLLPDFAEADLKKKTTRAGIVDLADAALVRQYPLTRLISPETRRRIIRRQLDVVLDGIVLNKDLPAAPLGSGFESFIVTALPGAQPSPGEVVEGAVRSVLGPAWKVATLPAGDRFFEARPIDAVLSVQEAWSASHLLRAQPGIADAEPNIIVPMENMPPEDDVPVHAASFFGSKDLPGTEKAEWSLNVVRARQAWKKAEDGNRPARGEGILIGHPDTGYTQHPENWTSDAAKRRLIFEAGWDFWNNDKDATDDLDSSFWDFFKGVIIANPGHGTGTSSVIFSDEGPAQSGAWVTGVAPRARLIPFRVAPTVVVLDQRRLADAIIRATDAGCHVISMSMGGPPLSYLHQAVMRAVENGVIVCAAAGNIFGANDVLHAVVWPAAYGEALGVAASNIQNRPWSGSSRGPEVDITAPGESVWHAVAEKGKPLKDVSRGNGTSFAVTHVAGIAALWLAYHGRDKLIATYGKGRLASVFREVVVTNGFTRPAGWKTNLFGTGIIDALKVLEAPLPPATAPAAIASAAPMQGKFDQFASLFSDVPRPTLRRGLARLLNVTESQLPARLDEVGDELLFHFFSDGMMRHDFRMSLQRRAPRAAVAAVPAKAGKPTPEQRLAAISSPLLASRLRQP